MAGTDALSAPEWLARTVARLGADARGSETVGRPPEVDASGPTALRALAVADDEADATALRRRDRLGAGGMGIVELAFDPVLRREVALKRLVEGDDADPIARDGLLREARITGQLEHPNIIPIHELGHDPALGPVVVMKRVQGRAWADVLREDRDALLADPAVLERHLRVLISLCHALAYAHSRGVVHRDIKPDNVMLGTFGETYLVDWGLGLEVPVAHVPDPPHLAGSPAYMAPEMATGALDAIDGRTDVYLLGATLHQVLTGAPRHGSGNVMAVLLRAMASEPIVHGPDVPPELTAICDRACAAAPDARYPDVLAFRDALESYLAEREARRLAAEARELVERLEEAIGAETPDGGEVLRRFHEARFALERAGRGRRVASGLIDARRRCTEAMAGFELDRGNLDGAADLLETLDAPPPALTDRLRALRRASEEERDRAERLARDVDPAFAARPRRVAVSAGMALVLALTSVALATNPGPGYDLSPTRLLTISVIAMVLAGTLLATLGRALWTTALDRQLLLYVTGMVCVPPVVRLVGVLSDVGPLVILRFELVVYGVLAIALPGPIRSLRWIGVALLAAPIATTLLPVVTRYVHMASPVVLMFAMLVEAWRIHPGDEGSER